MDAREIFFFAMERYSERVEITELRVAGREPGNIVDLARQNGKRRARISLVVEDEAVKNLKGLAAERDTYLLVKIPHEVAQRTGSKIILPSEDRR